MMIRILLLLSFINTIHSSKIDCFQSQEDNDNKHSYLLICTKYNKTLLAQLNISRFNSEGFLFKKIAIINKNITVLNNFIFSDFKIKELDLSNNEIELIQENSFSNISILEILVINSNKIKSIENIVNGLKFTNSLLNVNRIELRKNLINNLNFTFSSFFHSLETLLLDRNKINFINKSCFYELKSIRAINLDRNPLTIDEDLFEKNSKIEYVYITESSFLKPITFKDKMKMTFLYVIDCNLKLINSDMLSVNLELLNLENNQIIYLNKTTFNNSIRLGTINLSNNLIESIEPGTFNGLKLLKDLFLSNNNLKVIMSGTFVGLNKLYYVRLDRNELKSIESNSFVDNPLLQNVDIRFYNIDSISNISFRNSNNKFIDLNLLISFNNIKKINSLTFVGLSNSHSLKIRSNDISAIDSFSFSSFKQLRYLYLNELLIQNLSNESFSGLTLDHLDLSINKIKVLFNKTFNGLSCSCIDLSNNNIESIENEAFQGITNLIKLYLNNNFIKSIESNVFLPFSNMTYLDLSKNHLQYLKLNNFIHLKKLKFLNLSTNKIIKIKNSFDGLINLETIDLSNNFIEYIKSINIKNLTNLKVFNIRHNRIFSIPRDFFKKCKFLLELDLSYNQLLNIDFYLPKSISYLNLEYNNIFEKYSQINELYFLENVILSKNKIDAINLISKRSVILLNLDGNGISELESNFVYPNLKYLYLSLNQLSDIKFITNLNKLVLLNLSNNNIEIIEKNYFRTKKYLEVLDLSNNIIKYIEPESFYFESVMKRLLLNNISYNLKIDIYLKLSFILPEIDLANNDFSELFFNTSTKDISYRINLILSNSNVNFFNFSNYTFINKLDLSYYRGHMNDSLLSRILVQSKNSIAGIKMKHLKITNLDIIVNEFGDEILRLLDFSDNQIEKIYFYHFINHLSLIEIDLSFNKIDFIEQFTFINCQDLKKINLMNNRLKSLDIYLRSVFLEEIKINNNNIEYIDGDKFSKNTKNFKYLDFSNNRIKSLNFLDKMLNIYKNVDSVYLKLSVFWFQIKSLILSKNAFEYVTNRAFENLYDLNYLDISSNQLETIESDSFKNNKNLVHLDLSKNNLKKLDKNIFKDLYRMEYLNLSDNKFLFLHGKFFNDLENLKILDLSKNNLKQIQKSLFKNLNLNYLFIDKNRNLILDKDCFLDIKSVQTIVIDYEVIKNDQNKQILIKTFDLKFIKNVNSINFYKAVYLIYEQDTVMDCDLTLFFLKKNILVNLMTDEQVEFFLYKCQKRHYK